MHQQAGIRAITEQHAIVKIIQSVCIIWSPQNFKLGKRLFAGSRKCSKMPQTIAPRLIRAVAESTQPYGPFLEGSSLHQLEVCAAFSWSRCVPVDFANLGETQEYILDPGKTSSVYHAVIDRASAEPIRSHFAKALQPDHVACRKRALASCGITSEL